MMVELNHLLAISTGVTAFLLGLSTVALALRAFTRLRFVGGLDYDDAAMLVAQVCFLVTSVLNLVTSHDERLGLAGHNWTTGPDSSLWQISRYTIAMYSLTMIFAKLSVSLYYLRSFGFHCRWQRITIISLTAVSTALSLAYGIFTIASCGFTAWTTGADTCPMKQTYLSFAIAWSVIDAIYDVLFNCIGVYLVCHARVDRLTKILAAVLVGIGGLVGAASCARIAQQMSHGGDPSASVLLRTWSVVEVGTCIIIASFGTLRPSLEAVVNRTRPGATSTDDGSASVLSPGSRISRNSSLFSKWPGADVDASSEGEKADGVLVTKTFTTETRDRYVEWFHV